VNYSKKDGLCGNVVRSIFEDSKSEFGLLPKMALPFLMEKCLPK